MMHSLLKTILHKIPEERAHDIVIWALKHQLISQKNNFEDQALNVRLLGRIFPNPLGIAAGFDKNASCIDGLTKQGFGFVECGTVVPKAQSGNPKPRLFRLPEDEAIINSMGFNSKGANYCIHNIKKSKSKIILGLNIGVNKNTKDPVQDYIYLTKTLKYMCDYLVLNISSPNTPGLRNLHHLGRLDELLRLVIEVSNIDEGASVPIVLKISPDIEDSSKQDIVDLALKHNISAFIVSNTTISRESLINHNKVRYGGLSGKPLFRLSTRLLREIYIAVAGKIPIIASGGVMDSLTAYDKIKNGATLVQIYTACIYHGFEVVNQINKGLLTLLKQDGFDNIQEAVGKEVY